MLIRLLASVARFPVRIAHTHHTTHQDLSLIPAGPKEQKATQHSFSTIV
jgi:hypothetical protein